MTVMEIRIDGEALDMPRDFTMEIEETSPVYNDRGSQSVPATVPATRLNMRLLGAAHRIDSGSDPNGSQRRVELIDGAYMRRGVLNVTEAGLHEGYSFNVGLDNSAAYAVWREKRLRDIGLPPAKEYGSVGAALSDMYRIYKRATPASEPLAVFPTAIARGEGSRLTDVEFRQTFWEVLNAPQGDSLQQPTEVYRLVGEEVREVTVPPGYGVSPFVRVWRVLELVFGDLGLKLTSNPFRENAELARLVVLNNTADTLCGGRLDYSDLLPDCSVEEFMNALWVRFGLVYNIDFSAGTVEAALLRDVLAKADCADLTPFSTGCPTLGFGEARYVRLSAGTSLEGASPARERFEDFSGTDDFAGVKSGSDVEGWHNRGTGDNPEWDGDDHRDDEDYDPWEDYDAERDLDDPNDYDPFEQEWDDGRDDDRDYGREDWYDDRDGYWDTRAPEEDAAGTTLAREYVTGNWYRLDAVNDEVREASSPFFEWNPQPEGLTPMELTSADECVPVGNVDTYNTGAGNLIAGMMPLFLTGSRHRHTYVVGSGDSAEEAETPLAFMIAYTEDGKTTGRLFPEAEDGRAITPDDGAPATMSLLFQFRGGLFDLFWRRYDEILRHGDRSAELTVRIPKLRLQELLDPLSPRMLRGARCMVDTATYSLPAYGEVSVDLKLRTIQTQGDYDIAAEQGVPPLSMAGRRLVWRELASNFGESLDTAAARRLAAAAYAELTRFEPYSDGNGGLWTIDEHSAVVDWIEKETSWEEDTELTGPESVYSRKILRYSARVYYTIRQIWYPDAGDTEHWVPAPQPQPDSERGAGAQPSTPMEYTVVLAGQWSDM